jgi:hypothetical protein
LDFGWGISGGNRIEVSRPSPGTQWVNITADANGITNRLTIKVRAVNGKDPQAANVRINAINETPPADNAYQFDFFTGELFGIGSNVTNIPVTIWGAPITSINASAFKKLVFKDRRLTSIFIPEGVTSIGDLAFTGNQLTSVTIPNSVISIENKAFFHNELTSVFIGNGVTTIGNEAFANNRLTSVTIGNSVTSIGDEAFANNLTGVTIRNSITRNEAFSRNQLTSVTIPNSVTSIGDRAFFSNRLTSVTIGNSVTSIGDEAFSFNQLTSVTIGNSVTSIGDEAFFSNQLTSVTIPESVTSIGSYAFANAFPDNSTLTSVTIPANVQVGLDVFALSRYSTKDHRSHKIPIRDRFETVYDRNGKKAGTYVKSGNSWSYKR